MEKLNLTTGWNKTFAKSDKVNHEKVQFPTRFGLTLAADLYMPKEAAEGKKAAIIVCGPYGALKEQSAGIYAQTMAERGFLTLAFDPSFTGESSGTPRNLTSPEINTDDYSAAIDYLVTRDDVDENRIGIIGICGWGSIALSAASQDPRIKATVGSTTADLTLLAQMQRKQVLAAVAQARTAEAKTGERQITQSTPEAIDENTPPAMVEYYNYYRNPERGYFPSSINSGAGSDITGSLGFSQFSLTSFISEIESPVMLVHGDAAFTYEQARNLFKQLKGENKKFFVVPGASHTDLYDGGEKKVIPFDEIEKFFREYLA